MFAAFSTALSALTADETAINVVGNNLANLNTPGFKDTVVSFSDLVTQSLGGGAGETQVGGGVGRPITLTQFSQGAIQSTTGPLDAAIQGDGFFIVQGPNNATEYTRGGNFQVNSSGTLETSSSRPTPPLLAISDADEVSPAAPRSWSETSSSRSSSSRPLVAWMTTVSDGRLRPSARWTGLPTLRHALSAPS